MALTSDVNDIKPFYFVNDVWTNNPVFYPKNATFFLFVVGLHSNVATTFIYNIRLGPTLLSYSTWIHSGIT